MNKYDKYEPKIFYLQFIWLCITPWVLQIIKSYLLHIAILIMYADEMKGCIAIKFE